MIVHGERPHVGASISSREFFTDDYKGTFVGGFGTPLSEAEWRLLGFGEGLIIEREVKIVGGGRRLSAPFTLDDRAKLQHVPEALAIDFGISGETRRRVGDDVVALAGDL